MKHIARTCTVYLVLGAAIVGGLSACAPVMIGSAVMGSLVATDRRTAGAQLEDEGIALRAESRIRETFGDRVHVNVTSYNRKVLLTGEVPSAQDRQLVEQLVTKVENVSSILNELAVLGNTTLQQRSADVLLTGRVKAALVDAKDLYANAFKVVTERGTTFLMGRVTEREAKRASEIVSGVLGVQKVVLVLERISEDDLKALLPKAAP